MSELTTRFIDDTYAEYYKTGKHELAEIYLKSEADKVISELKAKLEYSRNARKYWRKEYLIEYKELRHQKFKRCLAMAKICENKLGTVVKPGWWNKWHKRWLELAKKFKEAK